MTSDEAVSDSGGSMRRLTEPPRAVRPDLGLLPDLVVPVAGRPAGDPPYFSEGAVVAWSYGRFVDVVRVVRDDERGLVAWLPAGSERRVAVPRDGRGLRDRSLAERAAVAVAADWDLELVTWQGDGLLRVAPTARPWSVWFFADGQYVNLERPHVRALDGTLATYSRDLTLDLWVEDGQTWLKDADELDAGEDAGYYSAAQARTIREVAEQARAELIDLGAWPLDEGWADWTPTPGWDEPLRWVEP